MLTHPRGIYRIAWQLRNAVVESSWQGDSAVEDLTQTDWDSALHRQLPANLLLSILHFCCHVPRAVERALLEHSFIFILLIEVQQERCLMSRTLRSAHLYMWKFLAPHPQMVDLENWSLFVAILPITFNAYVMHLYSWISSQRVAAVAYSH